MEIHQDFREFIELLNARGVKYLVVGGYAVNYYGYPRFTKDIDFWLWIDEENLQKLVAAVGEFGFGDLGLSEIDFMNAENIVQLGYAPYRIDLQVDIDGVDFQECYERRIIGHLDNLKINFISIKDLIQNKESSGRLQDLADAEQLRKIDEAEG